ncbi:MAG: hypothetical protein Q4B28_03880 [bacterium]|nr:hypothetical protein [bacterium]
MFFDTVEGPWNLAFDHQHQPQHFKFEQGHAQINPSLHNYPYYLSNINLKKGEKLIRSYQVNYSDQGNSYTIAIDDINIKDFEHLPNIAKTVPKD